MMLDFIGIPPNTKCLRIERHAHAWVVWTSTKDFKHGTYLWLDDDGSVCNITEREDEGPECVLVKPPTHERHA